MKYREHKVKRQEEFNKLPIFYAFGRKQMEEQLAKRGLEYETAASKLYALGGTGGYYLKTDAPVVRAFFETDETAELRAMFEADLNEAREAFEYEMANHEYPINWQGDWDVCECFGNVEYEEGKTGADYLRDLGYSEAVIKMYYEAARNVRQSIEW